MASFLPQWGHFLHTSLSKADHISLPSPALLLVACWHLLKLSEATCAWVRFEWRDKVIGETHLYEALELRRGAGGNAKGPREGQSQTNKRSVWMLHERFGAEVAMPTSLGLSWLQLGLICELTRWIGDTQIGHAYSSASIIKHSSKLKQLHILLPTAGGSELN